MEYRTVYQEGSAEIVEKKSRFIARVFPIKTEEEAAELLEKIKKQYWDARHHCWAYIIGEKQVQERFSDDGEPAGTAGKPILEVIRGQKLHNVMIIVIRYFGGTLLGTGGLVKAYGDSTKEVLKIVKTEELIDRMEFQVKMQYDHYTLAKRLFDETEATLSKEDFGTGITVEGKIPTTERKKLEDGLQNIGQGRIQLTFMS